MTIPADADREAIAAKLIELAAVVLHSEEPWRTASGTPLARPLKIEGFPIRLVPQEPWHAEYYRHPAETGASAPRDEPPHPTRAQPSVDGLLTLRTDLERSLSTRRHELPDLLRGQTLEELTEVLLMLACGPEVVLLADRDPWRFEHSPEELQAAGAVYAWAIDRLRETVARLGSEMAPETVVDELLTQFVEGR
jgi:hypothetical protein